MSGSLPSELRRKLKNNFGYGCKSGKRRYKTHGAAFQAMLKINAHEDMQEDPLRNVYRCPSCGGWHTTRKEP